MARYRDTNTGHFVSRGTWTRSKAQGGTRFVRETVSAKERAAREIEAGAPPPPEEGIELIRTLDEYQELLEDSEEIFEEEETEYAGATDSP